MINTVLPSLALRDDAAGVTPWLLRQESGQLHELNLIESEGLGQFAESMGGGVTFARLDATQKQHGQAGPCPHGPSMRQARQGEQSVYNPFQGRIGPSLANW
jgi:hypothetical protein